MYISWWNVIGAIIRFKRLKNCWWWETPSLDSEKPEATVPVPHKVQVPVQYICGHIRGHIHIYVCTTVHVIKFSLGTFVSLCMCNMYHVCEASWCMMYVSYVVQLYMYLHTCTWHVDVLYPVIRHSADIKDFYTTGTGKILPVRCNLLRWLYIIHYTRVLHYTNYTLQVYIIHKSTQEYTVLVSCADRILHFTYNWTENKSLMLKI